MHAVSAYNDFHTGGVLESFHSVIVIGGSAGSIETLKDIVPKLDPRVAPPVLIVVHIPPSACSVLPQILGRHSQVSVHHVEGNENLEPAVVYVAPPDRHLAVSKTQACVLSGARINRNRPSIDPLFISAARAFGPRVVAVLLSGYLDDGVAGLIAVKEAGGRIIIQDPSTTIHPDMPNAALARVEADYVLSPALIGQKLNDLASAMREEMSGNAPEPREGVDLTLDKLTQSARTPQPQPTPELAAMSCPDCGGVLQAVDGTLPDRFRCRVGHAFSLESLLSAKSEEIETALWTAVRALEEKAEMSRSLSLRLRVRGAASSSSRYNSIADDIQRDADLVRKILEQIPQITTPSEV